ncbi:MAG: site-specific recombinase resolvase [Actinomycetota bacterium]
MNGEMETFVPMELQRRGVRRLAVTETPAHDTTFLEALGRAFYWQRLINEGMVKSGSEIARREGLHPSTVNELLRLTLLAPDIIEMLMAGRQPRRLTLMWFQRNRLPVDWQAQRDIIRTFR